MRKFSFRSTAVRLVLLLAAAPAAVGQPSYLRLDDRGVLSARGLDVLVFSNWYSGLFSDSKLSGVELVHHGVRTATNGDVRLSNTPEQWDPIPQLVDRTVDAERGAITARLAYPDHGFEYRIEVRPDAGGALVAVHLDAPLPAALEGRAGFNLEFLPSAYFGKTYVVDDAGGAFPRIATGRRTMAPYGMLETEPLATGGRIVLAPGDPERRVTIDGRGATLSLYDGRTQAQNGWFVVRSLLPAGQTGRVLEWLVTPNRIPDWTRRPVIAHSQVGYHPGQEKIAVLELDPRFEAPVAARLLRILPDGRTEERLAGPALPWGPYLRYEYRRFDFTAVEEPGLYVLEYAGVRSEAFRIGDDVYRSGVWQPTLDTFMPVQMDHVLVNDRYRVWHGAGHLDDALQAPVDHEHFDLYAQGPTTDSPFEPGEHIPGLNVGGWHDAGDYDIRTQSQYATVQALVLAHETFGIDRDQTTVRQEERFVDLGVPDGVPDILQQVEHGVLALLAQYRAVGHAIPGIIVPTIAQYTHLGDAVTMTDNLVFDPSLDSLETDGRRSGTFDDRWAFTSRSTPLDYGSIAALAAASRVLRGYRDALADECLSTARRVWDEEQSREPVIFRWGNTTGGPLEIEEAKATVELLVTTGERKYADRLAALWPGMEQRFGAYAALAVRAMPFMDDDFRGSVEAAVRSFARGLDEVAASNPFGVPVTTGGWGGSGAAVGFAMTAHILHRAFPEIVPPEHTLRGLAYVLGTHPASSVSMVSGVGARSMTAAYGANRADWSFIPGGIVPGIVIVQPDLPELKEDWPFLWYEGEYVIPLGATFLYVANAADSLFR
jgi:hypothetical protein